MESNKNTSGKQNYFFWKEKVGFQRQILSTLLMAPTDSIFSWGQNKRLEPCQGTLYSVKTQNKIHTGTIWKTSFLALEMFWVRHVVYQA